MIFHGFQKMTLLDYPGKVACTVFTGGCNLRCPFCHNAPLVTELAPAEDGFIEAEVLDTLKKRQGVLDGIAVTGGEPLLQPGLPAFLEKVRALGLSIKLDTNGTFPDRLRELVQNGLVDYVAVDIKNSRKKYALTVGVPDFRLDGIEKTVRFLLSGAVDFEFRTTVVQELHKPEDIADIADWIAGAPRYFLQNFVDSGNLIGHDLHAVPKETLTQMRDIAGKTVAQVGLRGV